MSKSNTENENEQECFQIKILGLIRNTNTESNKNNNCYNMDTKRAKKGKAYIESSNISNNIINNNTYNIQLNI